ncbi:hypothetical protein [Bdellovibrio svalbardensis]|uniref:Uncharacterized protein n=1 Tax=Bdellovibrio svalbardensis TaxID=2972972 RepID=A0ABT6DDT0_9BACT|nr:hypothetical protein [Bdellovibrio svalbardensis]MDG0815005.1 hypothetical protein [Bdellovibrio svalbardensis]
MTQTTDSFYVETFKREFQKRATDLKLSFNQDSLNKISESHLEDLITIPGIFFDADTKDFISTAAGRSLAQELAQAPQANLESLWPLVIESFKKNNYWGFPTYTEEQTQKRTEAFKELRSYIFTLIQAMIIMKVVIFYFGLKSASDASTTDLIWTGLAIAFSFLSLFFFAWRKSRKKK